MLGVNIRNPRIARKMGYCVVEVDADAKFPRTEILFMGEKLATVKMTSGGRLRVKIGIKTKVMDWVTIHPSVCPATILLEMGKQNGRQYWCEIPPKDEQLVFWRVA